MDRDNVKAVERDTELNALIEEIVNGVDKCDHSATCGGCAACSSSCAHPTSCIHFAEGNS